MVQTLPKVFLSNSDCIQYGFYYRLHWLIDWLIDWFIGFGSQRLDYKNESQKIK